MALSPQKSRSRRRQPALRTAQPGPGGRQARTPQPRASRPAGEPQAPLTGLRPPAIGWLNGRTATVRHRPVAERNL